MRSGRHDRGGQPRRGDHDRARFKGSGHGHQHSRLRARRRQADEGRRDAGDWALMTVFQHPPEVAQFWRKLVTPLVKRHPAPFYLFSAVPVDQALRELKSRFSRYPIRHWLSFKTQPLRPLLQWWNKQGLSIEVVSEFEFLAARKEGFSP